MAKLGRVIHNFKNGRREDDRAMRRCRTCGGVQYDWGVGLSVTKRGKARWCMFWYCAGRGSCGRGDLERMTYQRVSELRQKPPVVKPAPGYPWCELGA
jgi:hypothetical protein